MRLYLSSVGIPNRAEFQKLFATKHPKIGLIANAWDTTPPSKRRPYIQKTTQQLIDSGVEVAKLNLLDGPALDGLDGIWLMGGNTFYLNWAIQQGNLASRLRIVGDNFIFGGESAGAVVAGSTLHGIEFLDNPQEAPDIFWQGLGLVPYGIVPHWETIEDATPLAKCYTEMIKYTVVQTLTDSQFIIV